MNTTRPSRDGRIDPSVILQRLFRRLLGVPAASPACLYAVYFPLYISHQQLLHSQLGNDQLSYLLSVIYL